MSRVALVSIVICVVCLAFVASCGKSIPDPDDYVRILELRDHPISYAEMTSVLAKHHIDIPFYTSTSGTYLHAVVIEFDILDMSGGATYDEVRVTMSILEHDGIEFVEGTDNIKTIAAIPESVDRPIDVEESSEIEANLVAEVSALSGSVGAKQSETERYARLYRTLTANRRSLTDVIWSFKPFKDEPIPPGTHYVFALVEVRDPTHSYKVQVHSNCSYGTSSFFGLFQESRYCVSSTGQLDLVEGTQPVAPSASQEAVLLFGGDRRVEDGLIAAVDWSSLARDRDVDLVFRDLEGGEVNLGARSRDVERCRESLAEAAYFDGYPGFRLMIAPADESLVQLAELLADQLADCGFGASLETFDSYQEAYQVLTHISTAGESGLLLSR